MSIMVQISELDLRDSDGEVIFEDLHFRLNRGEWACVVGPPGSGKTALLKLICGELRPHRGQILVDDRNIIRIHSERLRQLRRRMGIVLDEMRPLMRRRALESTLLFKLRLLGMPHEDAALKTEETLTLIGLDEHARRTPDELDDLEGQLLSLGLALSHDPIFLLLDDPLRGLEKNQIGRYVDVLERAHLRKRLSILMTAREPSRAEQTPAQLYAIETGALRALRPQAAVPQRSSGARWR